MSCLQCIEHLLVEHLITKVNLKGRYPLILGTNGLSGLNFRIADIFKALRQAQGDRKQHVRAEPAKKL